MKHFIYIFAAALAVAACTREPAPSAPASEPVVFTAHAELNPGTKAILDLNGSSKPQNFWEDGDAINVFTSADADGDGKVSGAGYEFTTSLGANATSAEFAYAGAFTVGKTFAIYPYLSHSRGVNYSGSEGTYRMAGVKIPESQTLVAGSFDRKAGVMIAYAESGTTLEFKNAVALLKFQVSESDIKGGCVMVDQSDAIAGTFRADVNTSTYDLSLEKYSGTTTYDYVTFTIDGSSNLSTGTDYYVAVRPTALTSSLKIYLNGNLVKTISKSNLPAIERNKIYNLGTLTTPANSAQKALIFDFTKPALTGWPTADKWAKAKGEYKDCNYPLFGTTYSFRLTDVGNSTQGRVFWDATGLKLNAVWRYVGLPTIPGYKLVSVSGVHCTSDSASRKAAISTNVAETNSGTTMDEAHTFVTGGEAQAWATKGMTYRYNLSGTVANTMYYFMCYAAGLGTYNLELIYEKVD